MLIFGPVWKIIWKQFAYIDDDSNNNVVNDTAASAVACVMLYRWWRAELARGVMSWGERSLAWHNLMLWVGRSTCSELMHVAFNIFSPSRWILIKIPWFLSLTENHHHYQTVAARSLILRVDTLVGSGTFAILFNFSTLTHWPHLHFLLTDFHRISGEESTIFKFIGDVFPIKQKAGNWNQTQASNNAFWLVIFQYFISAVHLPLR